MSTVVKDLGAVSAYAYAVEKGYTGTEEEFAELMADYANVGQRAEDAAGSAMESKTAAQTAATTATNKASEATTAAQTATTKAGEATTAKNDAVSAKTAAETAQGKAEDAQAAAESVAESIPSDYSQLSEDVSELKSGSTKSNNTKDIRVKSYDFSIKKHNNINYIDRMEYSSLNKGTAISIGVDGDYTWQGRPYSIFFKTDPSRTSSECRINYSTAFKLLGTQEFDIAVYISDATKVTNIRVSCPACGFVKSSTQMNVTLVNGWNYIRIVSEGAGSWDENADNTQIRILASHSEGAEETIYIGYLMQVVPQYGNMIIIDDGPYYSFFTEAYPSLKTLGVPVTWALDFSFITDNTSADRTVINLSDLDTLATDGISEFSFHSYDNTIMSTATAEEALADTLVSIRCLKQKGLNPERIWRAAWLQNSCAHPELANLELDASASHDASAGVVQYPFFDKYNIARIGVAGKTETQIDNLFLKLKNQHCTVLFYFHGISNGEKDVSPTMLSYFLNKIEEAIDDGYLNPTTYNRLVRYYSEVE